MCGLQRTEGAKASSPALPPRPAVGLPSGLGLPAVCAYWLAVVSSGEAENHGVDHRKASATLRHLTIIIIAHSCCLHSIYYG